MNVATGAGPGSELRPELLDPLSPVDAAVSGSGVAAMRIVRGSAWYLGGQVATLLVAFVATPFVIRLLGPEKYGALALINLLVGCLAWSDLGMAAASTRFAAAAHARDDAEGEVAAIWGSLLLGPLSATLAASALMLWARPLLVVALHVPVRLQDEAVLALRLVAIALVARVVVGVLNTPQLVRLRMRLHTAVTTASSVAQILLTPAVLLLGGGLAGVAAGLAGVAIATAFGQGLVAQRLLPQLAHPHLEPGLLGRLARFGGTIAATNLAVLFLTSGEKFFLTRFVSVTALAHYTVAFTLANLLIVPVMSLLQALLPTFARLQAAGRSEELERLYAELLRGVLLLLPAVALAFCLAAKPFFTLWAGPAFGAESTPLFFILMVGLLASAVSQVPGCLLVALGRADFSARYHFLELLPYLALAAALTARWGTAGAASVWSLRALVALPVYLRAARRRLGVRRPQLAALGASYAGALAVLWLPPLVAIGMGSSWPLLLVAGATSAAAYLWLVLAWLLQGTEKAWVRSKLLAVTRRRPAR